MDEQPPRPGVDARSVRFELGAIAVVLLGGYVFGIIWVIPGRRGRARASASASGARANLFAQLFEA